MNRSIRNTLLIATFFGATGAAHAGNDPDSPGPFSYARIGTLGVGAGAGYGLTESVVLRVGANTGATFSGSRRIDGNRHDASRRIGTSIEALLDWYPMMRHGFRLTGGLMVTDTRTSLTARPDGNGNYTLNGNVYAAADLGGLSSEVRPDALSPYVGVGWESARPGKRGLRFTADAGVLHLRSRRASLTTSLVVGGEQLRADLLAEQGRIKAVNDFAPGLSLGASYTF